MNRMQGDIGQILANNQFGDSVQPFAVDRRQEQKVLFEPQYVINLWRQTMELASQFFTPAPGVLGADGFQPVQIPVLAREPDIARPVAPTPNHLRVLEYYFK